MKLKNLSIALALAFSISTIPKKSEANPAVFAPAALCAGTAGVGCVLIGAATIGGTVYYVWKLGSGKKSKKVYATADGQVMKLWNTSKENHHTVYGGKEECEKMGKRNGFGDLIKTIPLPGNQVTCVFKGKQTSFGGGDN